MRSMPKIAATINASRMMTDRTGALTAISPIRSSPKAMLEVGFSSTTSTWTSLSLYLSSMTGSVLTSSDDVA
jgi:hypothetical protein